ncbi:hypothetical protein [Streptomyces albogriseolus]|uniref:hypothetical protein n=1 Tax=Streptomyces albogriseolus TaxID=1887 RepID=UPI0033BBD844
MGARVAVIGRSRRGEDAAKALGADLFVPAQESDPAEALKEWEGGADLVQAARRSRAAGRGRRRGRP